MRTRTRTRTKERLLSLFTALCLTLGLLPTAALAATSPATSVKVGGVELTNGKYLAEGASAAVDSAPSSGGYAYFYNGALTLKDFSTTTSGVGIQWKYSSDNQAPSLTIQLEGTSNITSNTATAIDGNTGNVGGTGPCLTITGGGTLNVTGYNHAIWSWQDITITGGATVNAESTSDGESSICIANNTPSGTITVDNATVIAKGGRYGIGYSTGESNANTPIIKSGTVMVSGTTAAFKRAPDLSGYTDAHTIKAGDSASSAAVVESIGSEKYVSITPSTVDTYTVSGTIKDTKNQPISGATVQLCKADTSESSEVKNTNTDNNGAYKFTGVAAGNYTIQVTKTGFQPCTSNSFPVNADVTDKNLTLTASKVTVRGVVLNSSTPYLLNDADAAMAAKDDGVTTGYAYFDAANDTLTLNGATISSTSESTEGIKASADLTIQLVGENSINTKGNAIFVSGSSSPKLTIAGTGKLTAESTSGGSTTIYVASDITIKDGATVETIRNSGGVQAMHSVSGTITITGAGTNVTATNSGSGIAILAGSTTSSAMGTIAVKDSAALTARGRSGALACTTFTYPASDLDSDYTITVSKNYDGSSPEASYDASQLSTYRYVKVGAGTAPVTTPEETPNATFTATGPDTGTLTYVSNGMKYSTDGSTWTDITGESVSLTGLSACTIRVVKKSTGSGKTDSAEQCIAVIQSVAPTVTKTDVTATEKGTITISNETDLTRLQYKKTDENSWQDVTEATITGLEAGTYYVRVKPNGTYLASPNAEVTINAYVPATSYGVWIGSTEITSANVNSLGSGISYDPTTKTLTLNGANITGGPSREYTDTITDACGIYSKHDLTIKVINENTITGAAAQDYGSYGIFVSGRLNIYADTDNAKLTVRGGKSTNSNNAWVAGIYANSITVNGCHVIAIGGSATTDKSPVDYAMSTAPALYKATVKTAARNTDGLGGETYDSGKIHLYKYLEIERNSADTSIAPPVFDPDGGYFNAGDTLKVTISSPTASYISYTTDGSDPTTGNETVESTKPPRKEATLDTSTADTITVKAIAYNKDTGGKVTAKTEIQTATFTKREANSVAVTGVELNKSELTKKVGETVTLTAMIEPSDAAIRDVVWASDDTSVATVDENGTVTAKAVGKARITATTKDGGFEAYCDVIVEAASIVDPPAPTPSTTPSTRPSSGGSSRDDDDPTYPVSAPAKTEGGTVTVTPKNASKGSNVTITVDPDDGYALDQIRVTDKNGDTVKLTDKGDGKYSFTMPGGKVDVKVSFVQESQPAKGFTDVPAGSWCYDAVMWAVDEGITEGVGKGLFAPDMVCTRAQIVTFLWRSAGSPEPKTTSLRFTDVSPDAYYYKAVLWAAENGYVSGVSKDKFAPDRPCTRAQAVAVLYRIAGSPAVSGGSFADVDAKAYYADAVSWAVQEGITSGVGRDKFGPDAPCTRAQIVTFLNRMDQGK